jgi:acetyl/propionyl-CoA carboxylase alpha subunit
VRGGSRQRLPAEFGTFRRVEFPEIDGVRVDSGVVSGSVVSPFYDSMIAKVIAHAPTRPAPSTSCSARSAGAADRADHQPCQLLGCCRS